MREGSNALRIGSSIGEVTKRRCYVIAEIGQNHQGDLETAKELLRQAKLCGVDAVKSQKRDLETLLSQEERKRPYHSPHAFGATYGEHREALELCEADWAELLAYADELGLEFFGSPWDLPSAELLERIGTRLFKVPSAAVTHLALIEQLAGLRKPVVLSTGMSDLPQIDAAVGLLGQTEVYVLQCTSAYPASFESVNLRAMTALAERYGRPVGLSGHHKGIAVDAAAVALGARVIERHFTLDRTWKGTDHAASLEPSGLAKLVRDVRAVEAALGDGEKVVQACELEAQRKLRGSRQVTRARSAAA